MCNAIVQQCELWGRRDRGLFGPFAFREMSSFFLFVCNAVAQKCLHQSGPKFQDMFISPREFVGNFLGNVGAPSRELGGAEAPPNHLSTSDFDSIFMKLEHTGKFP